MNSRDGLGRFVIGALVCVILLLGAGYVGVSLFTAERLTRATNQPLTIDPRRLSADAQAWSVRTSDGVTLRGWYLPTPERRRLIVLVHGMWSSWLEMAALGRDLHKGDYDVLLFDLRGHGQSDPRRLTRERLRRRWRDRRLKTPPGESTGTGGANATGGSSATGGATGAGGAKGRGGATGAGGASATGGGDRHGGSRRPAVRRDRQLGARAQQPPRRDGDFIQPTLTKAMAAKMAPDTGLQATFTGAHVGVAALSGERARRQGRLLRGDDRQQRLSRSTRRPARRSGRTTSAARPTANGVPAAATSTRSASSARRSSTRRRARSTSPAPSGRRRSRATRSTRCPSTTAPREPAGRSTSRTVDVGQRSRSRRRRRTSAARCRW